MIFSPGVGVSPLLQEAGWGREMNTHASLIFSFNNCINICLDEFVNRYANLYSSTFIK